MVSTCSYIYYSAVMQPVSVGVGEEDGWLAEHLPVSAVIRLHRRCLRLFPTQVIGLSRCLSAAMCLLRQEPPTRLDIWAEFQQRAVRTACLRGLIILRTNLRRFFLFSSSYFTFLLPTSYWTDAVTSCIPARAPVLLGDSSSRLFPQCF